MKSVKWSDFTTTMFTKDRQTQRQRLKQSHLNWGATLWLHGARTEGCHTSCLRHQGVSNKTQIAGQNENSKQSRFKPQNNTNLHTNLWVDKIPVLCWADRDRVWLLQLRLRWTSTTQTFVIQWWTALQLSNNARRGDGSWIQKIWKVWISNDLCSARQLHLSFRNYA